MCLSSALPSQLQDVEVSALDPLLHRQEPATQRATALYPDHAKAANVVGGRAANLRVTVVRDMLRRE